MEHNTIPAGTVVTVKSSDLNIEGVIVGKGSVGITESYIVRCTDGQLPNDTYEYDTFIAHLAYID